MSVNLHPLARRYGFTAPTVRKWRERDSTPDSAHAPSGLRLLNRPPSRNPSQVKDG